ncbi:MAG: hypothetical protein II793_03145, partial [Bacteroidales bacterium]|nr:hypothetical protein [Bacteroidales bacterium]
IGAGGGGRGDSGAGRKDFRRAGPGGPGPGVRPGTEGRGTGRRGYGKIHRRGGFLPGRASAFRGKTVIREIHDDNSATTLPLANGRKFPYKVVENFRPTRNISIAANDSAIHIDGDTLRCRLKIHNPYHYDIASGDYDSLHIAAFFRLEQRRQPTAKADNTFVLPASGSATFDCAFAIPEAVRGHKCAIGFFVIGNSGYPPRQSKSFHCTF